MNKIDIFEVLNARQPRRIAIQSPNKGAFITGDLLEVTVDDEGTIRVKLRTNEGSEVTTPISSTDSVTIEFISTQAAPAYSLIK